MQLDLAAVNRLYQLLEPPAPSGFEAPAAAVWRQLCSEFAAAWEHNGNSYAGALARREDTPTVLIIGHIDEIGLQISYIDEEGFLYFKPIGGWDPTIFPGQRVAISGHCGVVYGVIGRRATHLMTQEEQDEKVRSKNLWIDVGATSREQVHALGIRIGEPAVIDADPMLLLNQRLVSRALDNRLGCFIAMEVLREYSANPGRVQLVVAATTGEETSHPLNGAASAVRYVKPDYGIAVDLTFASDHPDLEAKHIGERSLGSGPALCRGSVLSHGLLDEMESAGRATETPYTLEAVPGCTYTDADSLAGFADVCQVGLVGVPSRYMHTPNEMVSLWDVEHTITMLAELCRRL